MKAIAKNVVAVARTYDFRSSVDRPVVLVVGEARVDSEAFPGLLRMILDASGVVCNAVYAEFGPPPDEDSRALLLPVLIETSPVAVLTVGARVKEQVAIPFASSRRKNLLAKVPTTGLGEIAVWSRYDAAMLEAKISTAARTIQRLVAEIDLEPVRASGACDHEWHVVGRWQSTDRSRPLEACGRCGKIR